MTETEVTKKLGDNQNIFDRIMSVKLLRPFQPFYIKYKEGLMYLLFGGLTTLLNLACFAVLIFFSKMNPLSANVIAFIIAVVFAYVTNRIWVFESKVTGIKAVFKEMQAFFAGRIATLLMEEATLWIGIDLLNFNSMAVKTIAQFLVIVENYLISKWVVFKKKNPRQQKQ